MPQGARWFVHTHNGVELADREVSGATVQTLIERADGGEDVFATTLDGQDLAFEFDVIRAGALHATMNDKTVIIYAPHAWTEVKLVFWKLGEFD